MTSGFPPINITNVLPSQSPNTPLPASQSETPAPLPKHLDIPGLRDIAVHRYSDWQQSKVGDETLKAEFRKASEVILAEGLDLE
jgi:hypothetical protein